LRPRPRGGGDRRADRLTRPARHGLAEWLGSPPRRDGSGGDRASFIYAVAQPGPAASDRAGAGPSRRPDPPCRHHLLFGPARMMTFPRSIVVLLLAGAALGGSCPVGD